MTSSFKTFRDRFPQAEMLSEVVLVQNELFVVKVTLKIASGGAVTALSAHQNVEIAEDRARERALTALGMDEHPASWQQSDAPNNAAEVHRSPPTAPDKASQNASTPQRPQKAQATTRVPEPVQTSVEPVAKPRSLPETDLPNSDQSTPSAQTLEPQGAPVVMKAKTEDPQTSAQNSGEHENETSPISPAALPAPINLSDVIAQTDIELRRLGWTVETGRDYLEKTYNKRSRHELSEEELIEFLCHLESL